MAGFVQREAVDPGARRRASGRTESMRMRIVGLVAIGAMSALGLAACGDDSGTTTTTATAGASTSAKVTGKVTAGTGH